MIDSHAHWFQSASAAHAILRAALPSLLVFGYVALAAVAYFVRKRLQGLVRDEQLDAHGPGGLTTRGLAEFFAWTIGPACRLLARVRFPPSALTTLSLVLGLAAGLAVAGSRFGLGGWLFAAAGTLDFLDGRVARMTGRASVGGAALDSVLDRYVEGALISGLCWYYRHDWALVPGLIALTGSLLVPYVRARGEALGLKMNDVGFMQRPERVMLLGFGTALSPILEAALAPGAAHPPHRLAIAALALLGATSHVTAVQRLIRILRASLRGARSSGKRATLPSALPSVVATLVDFGLACGLFYLLSLSAVTATALAAAAGALCYLLASRFVSPTSESTLRQLPRYLFSSLSSLLLNVGGVALVLASSTPFVLAWVLTRAVVFALWSYPLQRDFVAAAPPATPAKRRTEHRWRLRERIGSVTSAARPKVRMTN
jgi:phosphatidylglycerophosphate synthase